MPVEVSTTPLSALHLLGPLAQPLFYAIGLFTVLLLAFLGRWADRATSLVLGLLWAWTAVAFWFEIQDPRAPVTWLGLLLPAQALIFVWEGTLRGRLDFRPRTGAAPVVGALFLFYSLVLQPVLAFALHRDPFPYPSLGLRFDAVLFTFGVLLFLRKGFPRYVLVLPLVWAAVGGLAAFRTDQPRAWGLLAALLAGTFLALPGRRTVPDVEGNGRLETWYEHAARHQRTCGLDMLVLVLATCFLGFVVPGGESPVYLPARQLEVSTTVLTALALALWLSLPAWYNAGFRLLAWEATRGLRVVRRAWDWLTARWVGIILLSILTLWAVLTVYTSYKGQIPRWLTELEIRNLALAALAVVLMYAAYRARRRILIAEFMDYTRDPELEGCGKGLASRVRNELASITTLYRTIDEAMPPQKGQIVRVTVGVEDVLQPLTDVIGPDASAEIAGVKIPVGFFVRTLGWLVRGPRITGSLHMEGENLLLVADLSGGGLSGTWRVSAREDLPREEQPLLKTAVVHGLAEQLAYRIITSLGNPGSARWEAVRSFTHGLRAYRGTQLTRGDVSPELRRAEREFISALSLDRTFSQCHYNLGVVYQGMSAYESAEASYRQILEEDPDWSEAYYALATVFFDGDRKEKSGIFARKMIEIEPGDARAWNLNGVARYDHGEKQARKEGKPHQDYHGAAWEEIVRSFDIAAAVAWRNLCSAALRSPSSPLARERQLAVQCATNLGIVRNLERDGQGARDILEQAFRLSPRNPRAHLVCGESLFQDQKCEEARTELFRVFGDEPDVNDHVERWVYLLAVQISLGKSADERHACGTILAHMVPPEEMVLASARDKAAEAERRKEYGGHLDHFEAMLAAVGGPAGARHAAFDSLLRIVAYLRWLEVDGGQGQAPPLAPGNQDWGEAQCRIRAARTALPDDPGSARAHLERAVGILEKDHYRQIARQGLRSLLARAFLLEQGRHPDFLMKAVEHAEASVAQEPGSAPRRWVLGDAYAALGDFEEASGERETALNLGSSCEILDHGSLSRIARDYLRLAGVPEQPAPDARLRRGLAFFQRILQFVESRKSNKSEAQFAAHAAAHFWVGRFHCELGEHEKGLDHLLVARSMTFRPIEVGLRLGNVYSSRRSFRDAEVAFVNSYLATRPKGLAARNGTPLRDEAPTEAEVELLLSWAMLYAERNTRLRWAERLCRRAEQRIGTIRGTRRGELRALYQECLGWVLFRRKDIEGSVKALKRAAQSTGNARVYNRLAQVYEAMGGREALRNARDARERAQAAGGMAVGRVQGVFDLTP